MYREFFSHHKTDDYEIFAKSDETANYLFIFLADTSFVSIGGYGHYANPYTHFYHRGYDESFEKEMLVECYEYLYRDIFDDLFDNVYPYHCFDDFDAQEKKKKEYLDRM